MDNKITLLGVVHFKKVNNVRSNCFYITYLSSSNKDCRIRKIRVTADEEILSDITNGALIVISGQLLYSEELELFMIRADNIMLVKDRSGMAEDTIIIQYGNMYNQITLKNIKTEDGQYFITHPKPIPGNIRYNGLLKISELVKLGLSINTELLTGED